MSRATRESILWVVLIVCVLLLVAVRVEASPFPEADACKAPGKRVMTRDENGAANVRCVAPEAVDAAKEASASTVKVRVTYGRALPRDYAECQVVPTPADSKLVEFRCVALIPR
jgi:hypothetical protein